MKSILFLCLFAVTLSAAAQGKVGINTPAPLGLLHVEEGDVLFRGTFIGFLADDPPISGAGTRLIWYPGRAAFRAGKVDGTQWNKENIGSYSFATGKDTQAKGTYSAAFGNGNMASGSSALAGGTSSVASGAYSVAFDILNQATGEGAFAINSSNKASGIHSLATGVNTRTVGSYSLTNGLNTVARPYASVAIGRYNDTTAMSTTSWDIDNPVFIIGNGTSNLDRANALTVLKTVVLVSAIHLPMHSHILKVEPGEASIIRTLI